MRTIVYLSDLSGDEHRDRPSRRITVSRLAADVNNLLTQSIVVNPSKWGLEADEVIDPPLTISPANKQRIQFQ